MDWVDVAFCSVVFLLWRFWRMAGFSDLVHQRRIDRTSKHATAPARDYVNLALYSFREQAHSLAPVVDLRLPSWHLEDVLRAVEAEVPGIRHYILEFRPGHCRVLLYSIPPERSQ